MNPHDDYRECDRYQSDSARSPLRGAAVGALAFFTTWGVGIGATILIVRAITSKATHPREANEGFGDFLDAALAFWLGVGVSFAIALVVGVVVSARSASKRMLRRDDAPPY